MRTVPDKCPFCESPVRVHCGNPLRSDDGGFATYECRTQIDVEWDDDQWRRVRQSDLCRIREIQMLTKQRDEARERIKRLEEAIESVEYIINDDWKAAIRLLRKAICNSWKAKGAKL